MNILEENKQLRDKLKPKEPLFYYDDEPLCPYCQNAINETDDSIVCSICGQVLDWRNV